MYTSRPGVGIGGVGTRLGTASTAQEVVAAGLAVQQHPAPGARPGPGVMLQPRPALEHLEEPLACKETKVENSMLGWAHATCAGRLDEEEKCETGEGGRVKALMAPKQKKTDGNQSI